MAGEHDHLTISEMKRMAGSREADGKDASRLRQSIRDRQVNEINPGLTMSEIINRIETRSILGEKIIDLVRELKKRI
ncbi:hypothetical protein L6252_01975 [Candidatus Parcubacteria bacterium]|nr:hypothetical protein [Candidatus Parcubacteria bacterium]